MKNKYRIGLLVSFLMIIGCNDVGRYQIFYSNSKLSKDRLYLIDSKTGDLYLQKQENWELFDLYIDEDVDVDKWVLIETLDDKLVKEKPKEISE